MSTNWNVHPIQSGKEAFAFAQSKGGLSHWIRFGSVLYICIFLHGQGLQAVIYWDWIQKKSKWACDSPSIEVGADVSSELSVVIPTSLLLASETPHDPNASFFLFFYSLYLFGVSKFHLIGAPTLSFHVPVNAIIPYLKGCLDESPTGISKGRESIWVP